MFIFKHNKHHKHHKIFIMVSILSKKIILLILFFYKKNSLRGNLSLF
jgi:hypothetical protein